jgi:FkbM family methyltransferase
MHSIINLIMSKFLKITFWRIELRLARIFPFRIDRFISEVPGLIHVGANNGGERDKYAKCGIGVVWIEPNPDIFLILEENIRDYDRQIALQCLITNQDDKEYDFHVANNAGLSSSILQLKLHSELCPEVHYDRTIKLRSCTLTSLLKKRSIRVSDYPALVMDTQGSELMVLQGAAEILHEFRYIKVEVADFEAYEGCCQVADISGFMQNNGFSEVCRRKFAEHSAGGSYFDILYKSDH